jgi:hypothetical protein
VPLEHHDELGLPWDRWADGRVHRLVKSRDFVQSAEVVEEAAGNAARRLGKVARVVIQVLFGKVFVWVQFVDGDITLGEPCSRCGGEELLRVTPQYAQCASCGATLVVREPREKPDEAPPAGGGADDALIATLFAAQPQKTRERSARRGRNPRSDTSRLGAYTSVVLFSAERDGTRERLFGHALTGGGRPCLLAVEVAWRDGRRVEDPSYPAGIVHVARSVPVGPFGKAIHLDRFPKRTPDLELPDPLAGFEEATDANGYAAEFPWLDDPPANLQAFAGVNLVPRRGGGESAEYLYGYGRGPEGDMVLLFVRYRLQNGERVDDPDNPGQQLHSVRWVPLAVFGPVVDLDALLVGAAPG